MEDLLFYDIECFLHDTLVIFKNINNEVVRSFWSEDNEKFEDGNGFEQIEPFIKNKTLVGYNNYYYDDKMLVLMMRGLKPTDLHKFNDRLIAGDKCSDIKIPAWFKSLDCMQQIGVAHPSLKQIEGNMGMSIVESEVSFTIDRPLTEEEKQETFKYCSYDIQATIEIFKLRKHSYFDTKESLLKLYDNSKAARWNTTTISANILLDSPLPKWNRLQIPEDKWKHVDELPTPAYEMWKYAESDPTYKGTYSEEIFDCDIKFAFGGLHGENVNEHWFEDVKLLDVASMYPSIIINLNVLGRATNVYQSLKEERLKIKHVDKQKSDALKIVLNSVYGNLKNQYSLLFNPLASATVCIYGQMALFDLCRRLYHADYTLININTDGVAFKDNDPNSPLRNFMDYEIIWKQWEQDWNMTLELDEFDTWIQKDVNNYIAIKDGKVKVKGAETNKYHFNPDKGIHNYFANNDARIIQIALVEHIVNGTDIIDTLMNNLDKPILYQYILKAGGTYKGVFDEDGNRMNNVNRIFAVKQKYAGKKIYKVREDGGYCNFPDTPDYMLVWNEHVDDIEDFEKIVDLNHYYQIINKKLKHWQKGVMDYVHRI